MTFSVTDIVCFPLLNNKFLFGIVGPPYIYFHNYIILGKAKKER